VLAVAGTAAYVSYWHAYAVVRAHGETGITARLEPATIDGLVYASSMMVLYAARHRVPVPSLARWLLTVGIAAALTANVAQGWSRGPVGAVVAAWPAVSLVGSYELLVWLIRTTGAADRGPSAAHLGTGTACRAARRPVPASAVDGDRPGGNQRGTSGPAWRPAGQGAGQSAIPAGAQAADEALRPAVAMTRRWLRTGSACRPAIRCRSVGSPRCSDAHPDGSAGGSGLCQPGNRPHPGVGLCHRPVAVAVGQRLRELPAGGDVELGEDLSQVVLDGVRAEEQPGGDLRVGQA
jgi:hypothetical protein